MMFRRRGGQTIVEYMLTVSLISIGIYYGFQMFLNDPGDSSIATAFENARQVVQQPYP